MKKLLSASLVLFSANASAITTEYSALIFNDFTSPHSASMGPLAVGHDASLNGYSIMYDDVVFPAKEYSLIVGGDLSYKDGRVYKGSIVVHGDIANVSENIYLGLADNATVKGASVLPIDFNALQQKSIDYSLKLSQQDNTGTITSKWGGIYLHGDCSSDVQVFNVNGYELEKAHTFELNCIPDNATVIVNISGNKSSFKPLSNLNLSDFIPHRQQTIFNLYESTSLQLTGVAIEGLVLAPKADITAPSGSSNVGIIANSWEGSMYLDYHPYNGQFPGKEPTPIDAKLKWHWQGGDFMPKANQIMATPLVAQLNDDNNDGVIDNSDVADVIVVTFEGSQYTKPGIVRALSGIDGTELWDYKNGAVYSDPRHTPALADLDNDGLIDIVVSDQATNEIRIITNEGEIKKVISRNDKSTGGISIADLDGDGVAEILTGTSVYNYSSGLLYTLNGFKPDYSVFDADGDGINNYLAGGTLYDASGNTIWSYEGHDTAWFSSIANLDQDPQPEIVVSIPGLFSTSHSIAVLEHDGSVKWEKRNISAHGGGAQTVGAFLQAGKPGIAYSGYEKLVMLNANGDLVWDIEIDDSGSGKIGVSAFDFNGDGRDEVIYQDHNKVAILDSLTGKTLFETANSTGTLWEYPIVVDLEGDNNAELIFVANDYSSNWSSHKGVRAFESAGKPWKGATRIWNQHSYHQTNISQDGKVPLVEKPSWLLNNSYRSSTLK
ncbi:MULTISPECIES: choice-of-anchor A family protein [Aliivibrio]|uniref:Choice-of-anchor A family protein n=1 Tax=Aliivibrio finisterrensis TaxID=511998 RepID=A0A4Q5KWX2_9GAMM|nr:MULTISPECIES: choice-of-anchor A family protein [Aliivibrio]MDD9179001.1 choice-of-anchor A family protein [Aliivibrio sp. A6]RYU50836.1 choice-of-anchor A family protein [Aliivibrio finisterrensis]RYU53486.1 choice-of-anchor A family protein [Aliivibrio finisterrensis]RYU58788.1 choice-of-anchor A family protein [Aliivibrio finisterrensis]RYU64989.1 choice-of-anchor A family protein [Aliivibrio finisterrensis]